MADPRKHELAISALVLLLAINIAFFPAIWGGKTLLSSSLDACSIVSTGAYQEPPPTRVYPSKTNDPGAIAWFAEPNYALIHNEIFHDNVLPLWNPYNGCGVPWLANMQSQVLNPLQTLAWLSPSPNSVDFYVLSRLFCAGLLTFLFLRQFIALTPAIFGAIAYMQCGYMMLYLGMPDISVCAYVPGLFWRLERLLRQPTFPAAVLVALFTVLLIYAGMPEVTFLALLFGAIFFIMRIIAERKDWPGVRAHVARYAGASIAGVMIGAPQIFPFLEYVRESFNAHVRTAQPPGMIAHSDFLLHVLTYFNPLIYGPLHQPGLTDNVQFSGVLSYWGTITFFLAILGATTSVKRLLDRRLDGRRSIDLIAVYCLALFLLLLAKRFGFPLIHWIGLLPVFKLVVFFKYDEPFIGFFVATLAAIGVNWIAARAASAKSVLACFAAFALFYLALLCVDSHHVMYLKPYWRIGSIALAIAFAGCILCFLSARSPKRFHTYAPFLVAAVFLELTCNFIVPTYYKFNHFAPATANPYKGAPFVDYLQAQNKDNERILGYDAILYPNWSSAFALNDVRDCDAMYPRRYLAFVRMLTSGTAAVDRLAEDNLSTRFVGTEQQAQPITNKAHIDSIARLWQLTSTRFILATTPDHLEETVQEWRHSLDIEVAKTYQVQNVAVYRLSKTLPRATLFHNLLVCENGDTALQTVANAKINIFTTAVIERSELDDSASQQAGALQDSNAPADAEPLVAYRPMYTSLSVNASKPGFLMLNDTWYPGWNAYIDGKRTKLIHADYLFRGVFVPAGSHIIEFKYQPHWFYLGLLVAAAGMTLLGLWGTSYDGPPLTARKRQSTQPHSTA